MAGIDDLHQVSYQSVGPTFGRQVTESALRALLVFLVVVSVFLWWRLEWKMAIVALIEVLHDLVLTAGIYALIGFEVTPATVIAVLTILGYSLYDTVVVFDKIQENIAERGEQHTISAIVNMSENQVLMRSINTSLTTLLPVGSLLFVGSLLLGATTLREFALGLFIGVAAGTYSSLFLGGPLVAIWKEQEEHWQRVRRRLGRKGAEDEFAAHELRGGARRAKRRPSCAPPPGRCPGPPRSAAATADRAVAGPGWGGPSARRTIPEWALRAVTGLIAPRSGTGEVRADDAGRHRPSGRRRRGSRARADPGGVPPPLPRRRHRPPGAGVCRWRPRLTGDSCGAPATRTSPTRWRWPASWPGTASTPRRSPPPCSTTPSRTPS